MTGHNRFLSTQKCDLVPRLYLTNIKIRFTNGTKWFFKIIKNNRKFPLRPLIGDSYENSTEMFLSPKRERLKKKVFGKVAVYGHSREEKLTNSSSTSIQLHDS